ncbi:DUF1853 family protein [Mesonia maritima]|uniref:DUF1853 family protein n=1 Tax=Mesonia maritima TaxID=1793873 RepID=UPI00286D5BB4|nr:DUF1853 family protein [Mesonia maritima]
MPTQKTQDSLPENFKLPESLVLGKRAERFFEIAINQDEDYKFLAGNLQIIHEKQTLGEFDFFLKEKASNQIFHVELVYKFYVYDPDFENELDCWIGPNRKDSLIRKIKRLKEHQLPLLFREESSDSLKKFQLNPESIQQKVCFKANLFIPKRFQHQTFLHINNDCIVGFWIHSNEFTKAEYGSFQFYSPKKKNWPIEPEQNQTWKNFDEINSEIEYLFQHKKAALLWMKKDTQTFERFFVVWW